MKKLFFVLALVGFASFAAQAQTCCSKGAKGASASADKTEASCSTSAASAAAKAASLDDSIEQRVDNTSGKVTFVRRTVDAASGESTYAPVEYCSETQRFINQAPEVKEKADCHKEGKASKVSKKSSKKACCTDGKTTAAGAACCTKESKSKASTTSVKLSATE